MTSATVGGTTWSYAYRGDGLRNSATTGATTRTFTWDVNAGLPVILDDGPSGEGYVYGAGLTAQVSGSNAYYYLADGLGSTMATTDASGAIVNNYTYDVYGKTTASSGSQPNDFQFAGQQTDPTGLQYLRARYYDPETGGFLSRDPLASESQWTANSFSYGAGQPTTTADPRGLYPVDSNGCRADRPDPGCEAAAQELPGGPPSVTRTPVAGAPAPANTAVAAPLSCFDLPGGCAPCAYTASGCSSDPYARAANELTKMASLWDLTKEYEQQALISMVRTYLPVVDSNLRQCAQNQTCRDAVDAALLASSDAGFQANLKAAGPEAWLIGNLGRLGVQAIWSPYEQQYRP